MKRKIYLSTISFTFFIWTLALGKLELTLMSFNNSVDDYSNQYSMFSSLITNFKFPWYGHFLILSVMASMLVWLFNNYKELLGIYDKEIKIAKSKANEAREKLGERHD